MLTLKDCTVIRDPQTILKNCDIRIRGTLIEKVGKDLAPKGEIIKNKLVTPGFVNAHLHPTNILVKSIADDKSWDELAPILHQIAWKFTPEDKKLASLQCFIETAKSGTTTVMAVASSLDTIIQPAKQSGLRAYLFGMPKDVWKGKGEAKVFTREEISKLFLKWRSYANKKIKMGCGIASIRGATDKLVQLTKNFCKKYNLPCKVHVAQCEYDVKKTLEEKGSREVEYLHKQNLLSLRKDLYLAQCTLVNEKEIELIAKYKNTVTICPSANAKFGAGFPPLRKFVEKGIQVLLGTDSSICNDTNNILKEAYFTALLYKGLEKDASFLSAKDVFDMITRKPAQVLGEKFGIIKEGYYADLCVFEEDGFAFSPTYNPLRNLIFCGSEIRPQHVLVGGEFVVRDYKFVYGGIEEKEIFRRVKRLIR